MPTAQDNENDVSAMDRLSAGKLFSVDGKVAVITGGGSGIGAMIAMGFVAGGATVVIASRKDTSPFAEALTKRGPGRCIAMQADLAVNAGVETFANQLKEKFEYIDVLVNNSGTNWGQELEHYSMDGWDKVYALNVKGVFNLTRLLIPLLEAGAEREASTHSSVVNISSIDSVQIPKLETYAYSSGKAAVTHMSRVLAGHLGDRKITVNAVLPGPFMSRMMRATLSAAEALIAGETALNRIGKEEDMAGVCVYLASPAGSFTTGAAIAVDGGALVNVKSSL